MSQRRMFSNRIANSAKFLQMPSESQLLYFHMILRADDDGVVESYPLMKLLGIASDNFKILLVKSFIKQLNEDQVVVITDWQEHNIIRADRKVDSIYKKILLKMCPEIPILEAKPRSDVLDNSGRLSSGQSVDSPLNKPLLLAVDMVLDNKKTDGGQSTDGVGKGIVYGVRGESGKVLEVGKKEKGIGDNSFCKGLRPLGKKRPLCIKIGLPKEKWQFLINPFEKVNPMFKKIYEIIPERNSLAEMCKEFGFEKTIGYINLAIKHYGAPYGPTITKPTELLRNLGKLIAFDKKESKINQKGNFLTAEIGKYSKATKEIIKLNQKI